MEERRRARHRRHHLLAGDVSEAEHARHRVLAERRAHHVLEALTRVPNFPPQEDQPKRRVSPTELGERLDGEVGPLARLDPPHAQQERATVAQLRRQLGVDPGRRRLEEVGHDRALLRQRVAVLRLVSLQQGPRRREQAVGVPQAVLLARHQLAVREVAEVPEVPVGPERRPRAGVRVHADGRELARATGPPRANDVVGLREVLRTLDHVQADLAVQLPHVVGDLERRDVGSVRSPGAGPVGAAPQVLAQHRRSWEDLAVLVEERQTVHDQVALLVDRLLVRRVLAAEDRRVGHEVDRVPRRRQRAGRSVVVGRDPAAWEGLELVADDADLHRRAPSADGSGCRPRADAPPPRPLALTAPLAPSAAGALVGADLHIARMIPRRGPAPIRFVLHSPRGAESAAVTPCRRTHRPPQQDSVRGCVDRLAFGTSEP